LDGAAVGAGKASREAVLQDSNLIDRDIGIKPARQDVILPLAVVSPDQWECIEASLVQVGATVTQAEAVHTTMVHTQVHPELNGLPRGVGSRDGVGCASHVGAQTLEGVTAHTRLAHRAEWLGAQAIAGVSVIDACSRIVEKVGVAGTRLDEGAVGVH